MFQMTQYTNQVLLVKTQFHYAKTCTQKLNPEDTAGQGFVSCRSCPLLTALVALRDLLKLGLTDLRNW